MRMNFLQTARTDRVFVQHAGTNNREFQGHLVFNERRVSDKQTRNQFRKTS